MTIRESFLFWILCAFGVHSPRHGRCRWCRDVTPGQGFAR